MNHFVKQALDLPYPIRRKGMADSHIVVIDALAGSTCYCVSSLQHKEEVGNGRINIYATMDKLMGVQNYGYELCLIRIYSS